MKEKFEIVKVLIAGSMIIEWWFSQLRNIGGGQENGTCGSNRKGNYL